MSNFNCEGERLAHKAGEWESEPDEVIVSLEQAEQEVRDAFMFLSPTDKRSTKLDQLVAQIQYLVTEFQDDEK